MVGQQILILFMNVRIVPGDPFLGVYMKWYKFEEKEPKDGEYIDYMTPDDYNIIVTMVFQTTMM